MSNYIDTRRLHNDICKSANYIIKVINKSDKDDASEDLYNKLLEIESYLSDIESDVSTLYDVVQDMESEIDTMTDNILSKQEASQMLLRHFDISKFVYMNFDVYKDFETKVINNIDLDNNPLSILGIEMIGYDFDIENYIFRIVDEKQWAVTKIKYGI